MNCEALIILQSLKSSWQPITAQQIICTGLHGIAMMAMSDNADGHLLKLQALQRHPFELIEALKSIIQACLLQ